MRQQGVGRFRVLRQPVVEMVAHRRLDAPRRVGRRQALLGLALELRVGDEKREQAARAGEGVLGGDVFRPPVLRAFAVAAQALRERRAQPRLVGPAGRRRHGVAIAAQETPVAVRAPCQRPFDAPGRAAGKGRLAAKRPRGDALRPLEDAVEIIAQAAGEMQHRARRSLIVPVERAGRAFPAHFHAAEQIRLRARHAIERRRAKPRRLGKDRAVGRESYARPPPVRRIAACLHPARRRAAAVSLAPGAAVARDLDGQRIGKRVDDRQPDAVQAARRVVARTRELAARM